MPQLAAPQLILIDLDGTLVDTVPDLAFCLREMLTYLGRPIPDESQVRHWIGHGVERLVQRALCNSLEGEPPEQDYARAYPLFLECYAAHTCRDSQLYPGVLEGLNALKTSGYVLGCVTSKIARFAEPVLQHLGLRDYFQVVVAGDTLPQQKPDPAPLLFAAARCAIDPKCAWMIGDSISDVHAARAAHFAAVICVSYGYNHGQDIRVAQPDAVIDSLPELLPLLA